MSTEPTDPNEPSVPEEPSDSTVSETTTVSETSTESTTGSEAEGSSRATAKSDVLGSALVADHDIAELETDTEEVPKPRRLSPLPTPDEAREPNILGPANSVGSLPVGRPVELGRLIRLSIFTGIVLGLLLAVPCCSCLWVLLPPFVSGVIVTILAVRRDGAQAILPREIGLAGATSGIMLGLFVTLGFGWQLWIAKDDPVFDVLEAAILESGGGEMTAGMLIAGGMVCLLPVIEITYAGIAMLSARWCLAKLKQETER